jgi:predicted N-formylglutamate amidohydrolase
MTETAFEAISGTDGHSPILFLCDHASHALPPGGLGLDATLLSTHIAYDIGAAIVTRALATAYGAPAVLGSWSRLLIDLNRGADDPTLVMKLSDGSIIPGNRDADAAEVARRIAAYHAPYHAAIDAELDRIGALLRARDSAHAGEVAVASSRASESRRGNETAVLVSMHSFTPSWKGRPRQWEVGVLYDRDLRLAAPLMARLAEAGFTVGDNEPYSGRLEGDTLWRHGTMRRLPHVLIEMRQDLVGDDGQAQAFALRLKPILDAALSDMASSSETVGH